MNLRQITLLIALPIILNFVNSEKAETNRSLRKVLRSINKFSRDLYEITTENETDNFVSSPLSLSVVLSIAGYGARGKTKKQIRNGLKLPNNDEVVKDGFHSLINAFKSTKKVTLRLVSKIYTAKNLEVKSEFKDVTKDYFQSPVESLDFTRTDEASSIINNWTTNQTNNCIKEIINADDVKDAALVLVNTIYFQGNWTLPFPSANTRTEQFHIDENITKDVEMMNQESWFNYGNLPEVDADYIELMYEHDNEEEATSMFVILPNKVNGLKEAQQSLRNINFEKLHNKQHRTKLNLTMPKFRVKSSPQIQPTLEKMGMTDMFRNVANFSGITNSPLKISKVVQKAIIEVTERGSTASAAAVLVSAFRSTPIFEDITTVKVDHPFIFLIYHGATKAILFQGHVKVP